VPGQGGVPVAATKTEVEQAGAQLPGSTQFKPERAMRPVPPPSLGSTPLAAAAKWAAGIGLGIFLLRRGTRSS
jgi:membrane protein